MDCPQPHDAECKQRMCAPENGTCVLLYKLDESPCPEGVCIAGGCFDESVWGGTGGGSGAGGEGGASSGAGGTAGTGGDGTGGSSGTGVSSSASGDAVAGPLRLHGGGCSVSERQGSPYHAPWLLLGITFAARYRRRTGRRGNEVSPPER